MILTIRTDKPEAEIGLYDDQEQKAYKTWQAHRELGKTIHLAIKELLDSLNLDWRDITGIVYYKGPGSFTGLRIGASVANALSSANDVSISAQNGDAWIEQGISALQSEAQDVALPEYGSDPHVTTPKK